MRASELELPKGMKVYLDMDGVIANFFEEYAKLAGVKSYRDVPSAKVDPTLNKMIGTNFFDKLPKFPVSDKIVDICVQAAGSYGIISSPLRNDFANSEKQKRNWIKRELNPQPVEIFITPNKAKHAVSDGVPNVLIDDRGDNISSWEAAGGIGIKFQADEDSLKVILDGLKRARRIGDGDDKLVPQELKSRNLGSMIATDKEEQNENFADGKKNEGAEITMWTNPEYQGADVDDKYYEKQPVKIVDISKLTPFEPADKMDPKDNHDNMMKFVDKIKAGEKVKPIVIVPHEGKLLIVDGHHRYFAHKKAGVDKIRAVIADPKDLTWRDDVPESIQENFADGKKKGKSRPGRVKKSGASCNGSVTSLRKKAKKASGEKAKMYHWCANMKSGKTKGK